jgi:hypothetical protein
MMRANLSLIGLALTGSLLGGCAAPAATQAPRAPEVAREASQPKSKQKSSRFYVNPAERANKSTAGVSITFIDDREPNRASFVVRPADIALDKLPRAVIPPPLEEKEAPKHLPTSNGPSELKIERPGGSWSDYGTAVVTVEGKLARLQIGNVGDEFAASDRAYRSCGPSAGALVPARWMTLAPGPKGKVTLRVVDAWFDQSSCATSVVRVTNVEPAPLLGGLVYAFRSKCDSCKERDSVTIVSPPLSLVAQGTVGKSAKVSSGNFMVAKLLLGKGAASSFGGTLAAHVAENWYTSLGVENALRGDAVIGVDVSHVVTDERPVAIAYATLLRR